MDRSSQLLRPLLRWTAPPPSRPTFRSFFSLPSQFSFFRLSLGVFSWSCGHGSKPCPTQTARKSLKKPRRPSSWISSQCNDDTIFQIHQVEIRAILSDHLCGESFCKRGFGRLRFEGSPQKKNVSLRRRKLVREKGQGTPTDNPERWRIWKLWTEHPLARHICARPAHQRTRRTDVFTHATRVAQDCALQCL